MHKKQSEQPKPDLQKVGSKSTQQKLKEQKEAEQFKRKYFDFYDDVKTSVKEDW